MRMWLRRSRGAIGIGLVWAVAWSAVGSVPRWVFGVETDAPLPLVFGVFGLIAGVMFSGILALTGRHRHIERASIPRFASWGALGGLLLTAVAATATSLGWGDVLALAPTLAVASAVSAAGSLAVARRAVRRDVADGRADVLEADVTRGET